MCRVYMTKTGKVVVYVRQKGLFVYEVLFLARFIADAQLVQLQYRLYFFYFGYDVFNAGFV